MRISGIAPSTNSDARFSWDMLCSFEVKRETGNVPITEVKVNSNSPILGIRLKRAIGGWVIGQAALKSNEFLFPSAFVIEPREKITIEVKRSNCGLFAVNIKLKKNAEGYTLEVFLA